MTYPRSTIRLYSALTMLTYVICHLLAHACVLISLDFAEQAATLLTRPWVSPLGYAVLSSAFWLHYGNALWSISVRRSLKLPRGPLWQLILGLCLPYLLMGRVLGSTFAQSLMGLKVGYAYELYAHWVAAPWKAAVQITLLITLWSHASIGIHFWLRSKLSYAKYKPILVLLAVMLPTLALSGYVSGGMQIITLASQPDYVALIRANAHATSDIKAAVDRWTFVGMAIHSSLILLPFCVLKLRNWRNRRFGHPLLTHLNGRTLPILPGATILETLQDAGIAHAAFCGGRGRCTTCRVLIKENGHHLHAPNAVEAEALKRIDAPANCRLACQTRPLTDITIMPLVPAGIDHTARGIRGSLAGSERHITVMFVDIRGFTSLGESRLPFDVLFILNQFFIEMTEVLDRTHGHYSQFTGDGLMALYGHNAATAPTGPRDALAGAIMMFERLDMLNRRMVGDLPSALRMGIGIHFGEAIVGAMGPPKSQIISAIGDTVNTTSRLESLTKDFNCNLILSQAAALAANVTLPQTALHHFTVKGRSEPIAFYALSDLSILHDYQENT